MESGTDDDGTIQTRPQREIRDTASAAFKVLDPDFNKKSLAILLKNSVINVEADCITECAVMDKL